MSLDLTNFMTDEARRAEDEMSAKLKKRRGVRGRFLKQKKVDNKRPLGFGKSVKGIPGLLRNGIITATRNGFTISFRRTPKVGWFHRGDRSQNRPQRSVAGLSARQEKDIENRANAEVAKQMSAELERA